VLVHKQEPTGSHITCALTQWPELLSSFCLSSLPHHTLISSLELTLLSIFQRPLLSLRPYLERAGATQEPFQRGNATQTSIVKPDSRS
jgi:hypothetical protein